MTFSTPIDRGICLLEESKHEQHPAQGIPSNRLSSCCPFQGELWGLNVSSTVGCHRGQAEPAAVSNRMLTVDPSQVVTERAGPNQTLYLLPCFPAPKPLEPTNKLALFSAPAL